eukprot:g8240.t1
MFFFAISHVSALTQWRRQFDCARNFLVHNTKLGTSHAIVPNTTNSAWSSASSPTSGAAAAQEVDIIDAGVGDVVTSLQIITAEGLNARQKALGLPYEFEPDGYRFRDLRDFVLLQRLKNSEYRYGQCVDLEVLDTIGKKVVKKKQKAFEDFMFGGDRMGGPTGLFCDPHHFAPHYVRHLKHLMLRNNDFFTLVEIGILQGTGLALWHDFFGGRAGVVGFDINLHPFLRNLENLWKEHGAFSMGLQLSDYALLQQIDQNEFQALSLYQNIDKAFKPRIWASQTLQAQEDATPYFLTASIVIDDASHDEYLIWRTFVLMEWYLEGDDWVYVVEDCLCTGFITSVRNNYPHLWIYQYSDGRRSQILFIRPKKAPEW